MTTFKLLSAGLIAATMLATPAMARHHHVTSPQVEAEADAGAAPEQQRYVEARGCVPAPRVGAYATDPWNNGNVPCEPAPTY
jgi:methionine-rich copper-binding protein CopC